MENEAVLEKIAERGRENVLVSKGNGVMSGLTLASLVALVGLVLSVRGKLITRDDINPAELVTKGDLKEFAEDAAEDLTLRLAPIKSGQESGSREQQGLRTEIQGLRSELQSFRTDPVPAWLLDRLQRIERDVEAVKEKP